MKHFFILISFLCLENFANAQCNAPANITANYTSSYSTPQGHFSTYSFSWDPVAIADSFVVFAATWNVAFNTWNTAILQGYTNNNNYILSINSGSYCYIAVASMCGGIVSSYAYYNFYSPCPVVSVTSAQATIHNFSVNWSGAYNAWGYYFEYRKQGVTTWDTSGYMGATSYSTPNTLLPGTVYEYRIISQCPYNYSISNIFNITTKTCASPANITVLNIQCNSAQLSYSPTLNSAATLFQIQWWNINDSANSFTTTTTTNSFGYTLTSLSPSSSYKARIRSYCNSVDTGSWVSTIFTTSAPSTPCVAPSISAGTPLLNGNGFTVVWSAVSGASYYQYQYKKTSDPPTSWSAVQTISTTFINFTWLTPGTSYDIRVRTACSNCNAKSTWSNLTQATLCPGPNNVTVPNATLNATTALIKWDSSSLANSFYIFHKRNSESTWPASPVITSDTSYTLSNLWPGTQYNYRVGSYCIGGVSSLYIPSITERTGNFTTDCMAPTNLNAISATTAVIISWTPVPGVNSYRIEWRNSSFSPWNVASNNFMGSTYTLTPGVSNITIDLRITSLCGGAGGQASAILNNVILECPPPVSISHIMTDPYTALVSWPPVPGANNYRFEYRNLDASGSAGQWNTINSVNDTSYSITNLFLVTNYEIRVKTKCFDNNLGDDYSAYYTFKTPCPGVTGLSATTTLNTATVNWVAVNGVQSYKFEYGLMNSSGQVSSWTTQFFGYPTNSTTLSGLASGSNYKIRMRSRCSNQTADTSLYSEIVITTLYPCTPPPLTVDSFTFNKIYLSWNSLVGAGLQNYRIRYKVNSATNWDSTALLPGYTYTLTGLYPSTNYQIQIKSLCSSNPTTGYSGTVNVITSGCSAVQGNNFNNPILFSPLTTTWQVDNKVNIATNCFVNNFSGPGNQPSKDIWYQFQLTGFDTVEISQCGSGIANTYLHLLDSTGTQIAFNDNNGPLCNPSNKASLRILLNAGIYYIVSEGNGVDSGTITTAVRRVHSPVANLNLTVLLEGYFTGSASMTPVLYNQGVLPSPGSSCDTIEVQLRSSVSPYNLTTSRKGVVSVIGNIQMSNFGTWGTPYYIVVRHRNTLETWSAQPILFTENTLYNFTTASNKAYGNNMKEVAFNKWALFGGDLNLDDNMDLLDMNIIETAINTFQFGYVPEDLNGDGNVDLLDVPMLDGNISNFIYSLKPN